MENTKNRIPRKCYGLIIEMLEKTNLTDPGDVLTVCKNDFGYLCYNKNKNNHFYAPAAMLRDATVCKIIEII